MDNYNDAKKIYMKYFGDKTEMRKGGFYYKYHSFNVPLHVEKKWDNELFDILLKSDGAEKIYIIHEIAKRNPTISKINKLTKFYENYCENHSVFERIVYLERLKKTVDLLYDTKQTDNLFADKSIAGKIKDHINLRISKKNMIDSVKEKIEKLYEEAENSEKE